MAFWRSNADLMHQPPKRSGVCIFASIMAALLMLAGAAYAAAHDHDDHETDFEGECVVCATTALGATKMSPDEPSVFKPDGSLVGIASPDRLQAADRHNADPNPARGPPLPVASS